jgi:replicative DNA helicase
MQNQKLKGKELIKAEDELLQYAGADRIVSSRELADELAKTDDSVFIVDTGIPSLDRILHGVEAGEMIIVTGPTGEGKTTLLMSITKNMAEKALESLWFTLEVTPRQFLKKLVKANGGDEKKLPHFYIPRAGFDDIDPAYIEKFKQEKRRDFQMIDWIERKIIEAKVKAESNNRTVKVVFIDHVHSIFSLAKVERNISLEIGDMVAKIKSMAIEHNITIFLIAHSKDDPMGSARDPRKEDIRDSGLISRLADSIIGVWRIPNSDDGHAPRRKVIEDTDNKTKVRVFKNRREGIMGSFVMYHHDHYLTEDPFIGTEL